MADNPYNYNPYGTTVPQPGVQAPPAQPYAYPVQGQTQPYAYPVQGQAPAYAPTQPALPYRYPNGYPIYPGNPYYYDPVLARQEYEKRLKKEQAKSALRYLGNMAGLSILLFLIFNTGMSFLLLSPKMMELYRNNSVFSSAFSIVGSFIYLFIPFGIIALLTRIRDKKTDFFPFKKMNKKRALLCIPIGAAACLLANVLTNLLIELVETLGWKLSQQSDDMAQPTTAFALVLSFLATAIMPALLEEFSLRGVILQPARRYGMMFAILSSSAIFGLMHGNLIQAPFAFMVGMCFAFLAIKCDSLWIGVILHMFNNGFSVIMSYMGDKMEEASFTMLYYVLVFLIAVAGVSCLVVLIMTDKAFFQKNEGNISGEEAKILTKGQKFTAYFINVPMIISVVIMVLLTAQYVVKK